MSKKSRIRARGDRVAPPQRAPGSSTLSRRAWIGVALGGAAAAVVGERWLRNTTPTAIAADAIPITVYSSPTCGCCHKWVDHLKDSGFHVTVESLVDVTPVKQRLGVPDSLWSCHTATVERYSVEGHVPADVIQRMLAEKPDVLGIAAPGMPNGSPGMEGFGIDTYEIVAFRGDGATSIYAKRRGLLPTG